MRVFKDKEEIYKLNNKGEKLAFFGDTVIDLKNFHHPGPQEFITSNIGKDIKESFLNQNHSDYALSLIKKLTIGNLATSNNYFHPEYATELLKEKELIHKKIDEKLDLKKPILPQIKNFTKEEFLALIERPRYVEGTDNIQIYENKIEDFFSKNPIWLNLIFLPLLSFYYLNESLSYKNSPLSGSVSAINYNRNNDQNPLFDLIDSAFDFAFKGFNDLNLKFLQFSFLSSFFDYFNSFILHNITLRIFHYLILFIFYVIIIAFLWSFIEYYFHRFLLHPESSKDFPENPQPEQLMKMFKGHLMHHTFINQKNRISLNVLSLYLKVILIDFILCFIFPSYVFLISFIISAVVTGALLYDLLHYYIHFGGNMPFKFLEDLKSHHMRHHYRNSHQEFGVTSYFWDWVYGTDNKNVK
jgi:hypothetical protein